MSLDHGVVLCRLFDRFMDGAVLSSDLNLWPLSKCSFAVSSLTPQLGSREFLRPSSRDTERLVTGVTNKVAIGLPLHERLGPPSKDLVPKARISC